MNGKHTRSYPYREYPPTTKLHHYTGNSVPSTVRTVRGFFYVSQSCCTGNTACPRENISSHLITEVKSCWARLISAGQPSWCTCAVCLGKSWLALYSTLAPPTSAIERGPSFSRSQPDLIVFLRLLRLSSLPKIDSQSKTSGLGAVLRDRA